MRRLVGATALAFLALTACREQPSDDAEPPGAEPMDRARLLALASARLAAEQAARAESSARRKAVLDIERDLQARRLQLVPRFEHAPRLTFARGVLAQLTSDALQTWSSSDGSLVVRSPLEAPRAAVALADGAVLALGAKALLRVDGKRVTPLPRPVFLPGADLFADAVQPDRVWISQGRVMAAAPELAGYRLAAGAASVLLPEQRLAIDGASGGVFGVSREGVWLYFAGGRAERFAPGGARLPRLTLPALRYPFFALPTRRLDQEYLLDGEGRLTRALVTPLFRKLSEVELGIKPLSACVADASRALAIVTLAGEGPRFELRLYDEELALVATVELPAEAPTGDDDWVRTVTRNLELACSPHEPRVAVGGPDRAQVFDTRGNRVLSMPSR